MIVRREQGRGVVDVLLSRGRLTRVTPNRDLAVTLLDQARAHLASGAAVVDDDPAGAFALVYDAARKALTAILVNQGLRTAQVDDVTEAIPAARAMVDAATKLLDQMPAY